MHLLAQLPLSQPTSLLRVSQSRRVQRLRRRTEEVQQKQVGEVPEALGVMWNNRPVLKASMGLGQKSRKRHPRAGVPAPGCSEVSQPGLPSCLMGCR